jgi:fermentation-respiration switch protein FrsA (DUF1100 family)
MTRVPHGMGATLMAAALASACATPTATRFELDAYRKLRGELASIESGDSGTRGRYEVRRVRLTSTSGLTATGWLYHPPGTMERHPAVLLQNGREENSDVIRRLPAEFGDVVVLSLDYPAEMPSVLRLGDVVRHYRRVDRAARQIPALFSLGATYLRRRPDVDSTRIAVAATSFAVPFATIAAAFDTTFRNVALIYGAGDLPRVIAANLTTRPSALRHPLAWLATRPFAEFAPERFIGRISPRPVVMVNGSDDPQMPNDAVRRLYDAARAPKSLVWMKTGHLMPSDSALIRSLVDTAFARMPVLHEPGRAQPRP